jgi:hypothetical protein
MLTKSKAFQDAEDAGYMPRFYVYVSTDVAERCFTIAGSPEVTGTGYWDGSRFVGDGLPYGSSAGVVQTRQLLRSLPVVNKTVTQGTTGLLTALAASQVGHCFAEFDNLQQEEDGRFFFSNLVSGESPEDFLGHNFEVRMGYDGLSYSDQISLFRGVNVKANLKGPVFAVSADGITGTLYDKYELPRSSLYSNPAQNNQPLPIVLGNMTENGSFDTTGDGTDNKGVIPLVCIDTIGDVWAMACHPLISELDGQTISLYDDDGLISPSDYVYVESGDYESIGLDIAYVIFGTAPTGSVTGKYKGPDDGSGNLITNPIECVEKLLDIMGETTEFDTTTFQTAKSAADDQGYTCAGVIMSDNPKAYWLSNILKTFIGSWFLNEIDQITLQIDTPNASYGSTVAELREELLKGYLKLPIDISNTITRPIINYAISYSQIDRRYKNNSNTSYVRTYSDSTQSEDLSNPIDLDWTRNETTIETIAARIRSLYSNGLKVYNDIRTTDFGLVNLEPGDYFSFGTRWQYDENGDELTNQIGRVINITIDTKNREITLDFYATGEALLALPCFWDGGRYVGDGLTYGGDTTRNCTTCEDFIYDGSEYYDGEHYYEGEKAI